MKTLKIITVSILGLLALQSCKKGENDPALSLKTRDARITGEWELEYASEIYNYNEQYADESYIESESIIVEDGQLNYIYSYSYTYDNTTQSDSDEDGPYSYSETLTIEKDGSSSSRVDEDGTVYMNDRNWWWHDSSKKKTQISFGGSMYTVDRLTNKELVLKADEFEQAAYSQDNEEYLESYSIEKRFKKK